jgi:5-methylcytosine-specific restriction endonuclease McrA
VPFDRHKYPSNWTEIRQRVLKRAERDIGDGIVIACCERCGRPNHVIADVLSDGSWSIESGFNVWTTDCGVPVHWQDDHPLADSIRQVRTVLTIAHILNPDPMDVRDENLQALCQRCHLRHDAAHHMANARATRLRKKLENQPALLQEAMIP